MGGLEIGPVEEDDKEDLLDEASSHQELLENESLAIILSALSLKAALLPSIIQY